MKKFLQIVTLPELWPSSSDGDDSDSGDDIPSERLRSFPSDLYDKSGIDHAQLSLLANDTAKLIDGLHSVGSSDRPMFES